eukprot:2868941-Prymnesium_polylepis.2
MIAARALGPCSLRPNCRAGTRIAAGETRAVHERVQPVLCDERGVRKGASLHEPNRPWRRHTDHRRQGRAEAKGCGAGGADADTATPRREAAQAARRFRQTAGERAEQRRRQRRQRRQQHRRGERRGSGGDDRDAGCERGAGDRRGAPPVPQLSAREAADGGAL